VFAAFSSHFNPAEKDNNIHWIAGWTALEAGQGMELKGKFLLKVGTKPISNPQPVTSADGKYDSQ